MNSPDGHLEPGDAPPPLVAALPITRALVAPTPGQPGRSARAAATGGFHIAAPWALFLLLNVPSALSGCKNDVIYCNTSENCPAEMACLEGICQLRDCLADADCGIEQFCDLAVGQCLDGCMENDDCLFGDECKDGGCQKKACRSTSLDCTAGQFCDVTTGTCFDAAGPYCTSCNPGDACGGGYNQCLHVGGTGPYCLPECSEERPCPAGYDCVPLSNSGEIISYYCVALCAYVNEWSTKSEP